MRRAGIEAVVLLIPVVAERGVLRLTGWKGTIRFDGSTVMRRCLSVKPVREIPSVRAALRGLP